MAVKNSLGMRLIAMGRTKAMDIIESAMEEYYLLLGDIAKDIYNSCIKDFYAQYYPDYYKRHGNKKGFNLYQANVLGYDGDDMINIHPDSDLLLPYGNVKSEKYEDKRQDVLDAVMSGKRGGYLPRAPEFPMDWYTTYPNQYSKYQNVWESDELILEDILQDFDDNAEEDLAHIAIAKIRSKVKK